jgi:hypothetical protein
MTGSALASLHVRFLLLVPLAVISASGVVVYTASERQRLIRFAASGRAPVIEGTRRLLADLARAPRARGGASAACRTLHATLLPHDPSAVSLGANTPDHTLFCRDRSSPSPAHATNRSVVQRAFDTRAFAIGADEAGRVRGKAPVHGGDPVLDETGAAQAVVFAPLDLARINRLVTDAQRPSMASIPVPDRQLLGQDGREALAPLQREHALQPTPVGVATNPADPCAIDAWDQAGAKSNVQKPANFDRLRRAIKPLKDGWFEVVIRPKGGQAT